MGRADRPVFAAGALLCGLAVLLGASGAHALKAHLSPEALGWWQTAVPYQMAHGLALLVVAMAGIGRLPAALLGSGAVVFCGTLYAMALGAPHWLGAVAPLGGLAMLAGWALAAWRVIR
jgi:uncharacterized membrane protein YgdD (TMEM256/DUF423 family)